MRPYPAGGPEKSVCYNPRNFYSGSTALQRRFEPAGRDLLAIVTTFPRGEEFMDNIEQRVKKIVAEQLGVNEADIKNESSFVDDLGADSLDTVELVMALEDEFETEIPDEEAEKITTVQQAIDYVSSHKK